MKKIIISVLILAIVPQIALALINSAPTLLSGTDGSAINGDGSGNMKVSGTVTLGSGSATVGTFNLGTLNGAALDATVSSMSAKLPASLGAKTSAASMSVVLASDQASLPVTISGGSANTRADTFTATGSGTTVDVHTSPVKYFSISVAETGVVTSWTVVLECSLDSTNFTTVLTHTNVSPGTGQIVFGGTTAFPCLYFRSRASALTLGSGTNVIATILGT